MNIGNLIDMLRQDPTLANDVPAFVKQLNEQNIPVEVTRAVVIQEAEIVMVSRAEQCGGFATEDDVAKAQAVMAKEPLFKAADAVKDLILSSIYSGEVTDKATVVAAFADTAKTSKAIDDAKSADDVAVVVDNGSVQP